MKIIEFTCGLRDLIAVAMHTGWVAREYSINPRMETSGVGFNFKAQVRFEESDTNTERAMLMLELLADKERIGRIC